MKVRIGLCVGGLRGDARIDPPRLEPAFDALAWILAAPTP